jgi:hypothetical protein
MRYEKLRGIRYNAYDTTKACYYLGPGPQGGVRDRYNHDDAFRTRHGVIPRMSSGSQSCHSVTAMLTVQTPKVLLALLGDISWQETSLRVCNLTENIQIWA